VLSVFESAFAFWDFSRNKLYSYIYFFFLELPLPFSLTFLLFMFRPTRLVTTLQSFWGTINNQINTTNQRFAFHLLCLLCGFFIGNVFGVFLTLLRDWFKSDLLIVGLLLCLSEFISFQTYKGGARQPDLPTRWFSWRPFNLVKLGLLFGFFVDAFKVGS